MNGGDSNQQQQQMQMQQWVAMQQYQQQWMAMQYPVMAMQQQMMYNQHYVPYYPQHQPHPHQAQPHPPKPSNQIQSSGEDNKTIWIGDLQQWMEISMLVFLKLERRYIASLLMKTPVQCSLEHSSICHSLQDTTRVSNGYHPFLDNIAITLQGSPISFSVKIIRNKQTGQSERYGFVEFNTHLAAENVLQSYNGTMMPNADQPFRLNWAAFSSGDRRPEAGSDLSIFVGDLATDVTDALLHDTFASKYPSVKGAKVVVDSNTGRSKGYGFVRFGDENEKSRAITEMNGVYCSSRPMRIGVATPKKPSPQQLYSSQAMVLSGGFASNGAGPVGHSESDSSNTTVFVGGLDSDVTDEQLRESFIPYGEVVSVKIPAGKGCGFVQFANRSNAEDAIQRLNGTVIGKQTVRLSWGRNLGNKQNGAYYGRQGYNGYGYAGAANGPSSNGQGNHQQPVGGISP
ncbi:UNVERIFIED_CONTAM: Polyadenylate-binding protein RBP47 [Sesamum latifolium]|uniref:Polyadenylate-binding protein RBP47 n=1 Tax=Sesamum latifolium TaxID=2727402 RepID=A0AAW2XJB0_9LAMI